MENADEKKDSVVVGLNLDKDEFPLLQHTAKRPPYRQRKHPWLAALEVEGYNLGQMAINRYVKKAPFAYVTKASLKENMKLNHWFWDCDKLVTNAFEHPYMGSFYFNMARTNNLSFWESVPYVVGGDLLWEVHGENELPSINDLVTTAFGGVIIGEVMYRTSQLVIDNSQRGGRRVMRELCYLVLNPAGALNRLIGGETWRIEHQTDTVRRERMGEIMLGAGTRHLHTVGVGKADFWTAYLQLMVNYGSPARPDQGKPFQFFRSTLRGTIGNRQDIVGRFNVMGNLWRMPVGKYGTGRQTLGGFGIYQHFNYYASNPVRESERPYQISEAASVGVGVNTDHKWGRRNHVGEELYASGVVMGCSQDDTGNHFPARTYNFGSGWSLRSRAYLELGEWLRMSFDAWFMRLYTWYDYDGPRFGLGYYRQGNAGHSSQWVLTPTLEIRFAHGSCLFLQGDYFHRSTHYRHFNDSRSRTMEWSLGLNWLFR